MIIIHNISEHELDKYTLTRLTAGGCGSVGVVTTKPGTPIR